MTIDDLSEKMIESLCDMREQALEALPLNSSRENVISTALAAGFIQAAFAVSEFLQAQDGEISPHQIEAATRLTAEKIGMNHEFL